MAPRARFEDDQKDVVAAKRKSVASKSLARLLLRIVLISVPAFVTVSKTIASDRASSGVTGFLETSTRYLKFCDAISRWSSSRVT
jgi:hypothetical protein